MPVEPLSVEPHSVEPVSVGPVSVGPVSVGPVSLEPVAQDSSAAADSQDQVSHFTDYGLEGVWDVTVTIRDPVGNPLQSFRAMNMYIRGGAFEEFGARNPPGTADSIRVCNRIGINHLRCLATLTGFEPVF